MVIKCLAVAADAIYRRRRELPRLATVGSTLIDSGLRSVRLFALCCCLNVVIDRRWLLLCRHEMGWGTRGGGVNVSKAKRWARTDNNIILDPDSVALPGLSQRAKNTAPRPAIPPKLPQVNIARALPKYLSRSGVHSSHSTNVFKILEKIILTTKSRTKNYFPIIQFRPILKNICSGGRFRLKFGGLGDIREFQTCKVNMMKQIRVGIWGNYPDTTKKVRVMVF